MLVLARRNSSRPAEDPFSYPSRSRRLLELHMKRTGLLRSFRSGGRPVQSLAVYPPARHDPPTTFAIPCPCHGKAVRLLDVSNPAHLWDESGLLSHKS